MLFKELAGAEEKDKLELVGRWEELTGFWSADGAVGEAKAVHELTKSDEAFVLYLRALASLAATSPDPPAYFTKLSEAPAKRAALLSSSPVVLATADTTATTTTTAESTPVAATTPIASTAKAVLSPSALITAIFSGSRGKGGDAKVVNAGSWGSFAGMSSTGTASASMGSEPIRVIVEEAKSSLPLRALKFVLVTLLYSFLLLSLLSLLLDSSGILRATAQTTPFSPITAPDGSDSSGRGTTFKVCTQTLYTIRGEAKVDSNQFDRTYTV